MTRLLAVHRPPPLALALLVVAAVAVFVAGLEHARLWHRGYAEVEIVGPLFLINAIASAVTVLFLVFDRVALFALGAVGICVGSLISIYISHTSHFLQWREAGYDATAKVIVVAEVAGAVLTLAGLAAGALRHRRVRTSERVVAVTA